MSRQFSDERSRSIRVSAEKGELKIHSSVSESGESEESVPTAYDGPAVETAQVSTRSTCPTFCERFRTRKLTSCSK